MNGVQVSDSDRRIHVTQKCDARSALAYEGGEDEKFCGTFAARYREPTNQQISEAERRLLGAHEQNLWAIAPMAELDPESGPVIYQVTDHLNQDLLPGRAIFINAGSHMDNVAAAKAGGVVVVDQDLVFDAVDWKQLLPILNLPERPYGRAGKGFTVMAASLVLASLGIDLSEDIVFQTDSEIEDYGAYNPLMRLLYAYDEELGHVAHAKMAKHSRNNEACMVARSMAQQLYRNPPPWVPEHVQRFAKLVFEGLGPDKWMLTGEWLSSADMALSRPFSTGYLEETLQALWSLTAKECGWERVRHVGNPNARKDGENSARKEDCMMTTISQFLNAVVMRGNAPSLWNVKTISQLNREMMPTLGTVPIIGQADGPVRVEVVQTERIIPSIKTLIKMGLVNLHQVRSVALAAGATPKGQPLVMTNGI